MTTKQIADFCEVTTKTIRRWIASLPAEKDKLMSAGEKGETVEWSQEEVYSILIAGGRSAVVNWMKALPPGQNVSPSPDKMSNDRITRLESLVEKLIGAVAVMIPQQVQARAALPPPPKVAPRDELRRLIASAAAEDRDYQGKWDLLYQEDYYRNHRNLRVCAKNVGKKPIDYADEEGLIGDLLAIAYELFGEAA